jgi:hypothetical protein
MNTYYEFLGTLEEEEDVADIPCVGCGQPAEDKWLRKGRQKTDENTLYTCTPCSKSDCRAESILIKETKALYEVAGLCEDESLLCTTCSKAQAYAVVVNKGLNTKDTKNHIPFCAECFRGTNIKNKSASVKDDQGRVHFARVRTSVTPTDDENDTSMTMPTTRNITRRRAPATTDGQNPWQPRIQPGDSEWHHQDDSSDSSASDD